MLASLVPIDNLLKLNFVPNKAMMEQKLWQQSKSMFCFSYILTLLMSLSSRSNGLYFWRNYKTLIPKNMIYGLAILSHRLTVPICQVYSGALACHPYWQHRQTTRLAHLHDSGLVAHVLINKFSVSMQCRAFFNVYDFG